MSSIAKIKANNTEYDVVGLGVENVRDDNFIGTWQGTQQQWAQAKETAWKNWMTDGIVSDGKMYYGLYPRNIGHDGEKFFGVETRSSPFRFITSTNGVNWTTVGEMDTNVGGNTYFKSSYINGYYYIATEYSVYRSQDGLTWTICNPYLAGFNPRSITNNGETLVITGYQQNYFYSTDNGVTWTQGSLPVYPGSYSSVYVAYGNEIFTALGRDYLYYSTDGINWQYTTNSLGSASTSWYIQYGNGRFVTVNSSKEVAYSTDGINWTIVSTPIWTGYGNVNGLVFANGTFFCAGSSGNTYYSPNGESWIKLSATSDDYPSATWGSDCYYPAGGSNAFVVPTTYSTGLIGVFPVSVSSCYTTDAEPTTESTVYSAPNTTSALTITSVGTGTITLSDNQVYNRQAGGDTQTYQDVASLYPNHLAFVDNVGVKIGNTLIANSTDISGKADVDLTNVSNSGTSLGAGWSMPSSQYDNLTLGASGTNYEAPANGWFYLSKVSGSAGKYLNIYNDDKVMSGPSIISMTVMSSTDQVSSVFMPVKKGDYCEVVYNFTGETRAFRFVYANGSAWEKV